MGRKARLRLAELSTIMFPEPITLEKAKDLMRYLAKELPCDYSLGPATLTKESYHNSAGNIEEKAGYIIFKCKISRNSTQDCIEGLVPREGKEFTKLAALKFKTEPRCHPLKFYGDKVQLWNDTRDCVERYFRASTPKPF